MNEYTAEDLLSVFQKLSESHWQGLVVGGQAVNLWCSKYEHAIPQLAAFHPIVSRDLDFHGGPQDARLAMKYLGGKGKINSGTDPSPNAGVIEVPMPDGSRLLIDILTTVYGVSSSELIRTGVEWEFRRGGFSAAVRVMHPLLLLESKLACFRSLSQAGRQDAKHAQLMILVIKAWLTKQLSEPRSVFRAVERLVALMTTPDGLNAYSKKMNLWDAIPIDEMKSDLKYEVFFAKRYSQLVNETNAVRSRAE